VKRALAAALVAAASAASFAGAVLGSEVLPAYGPLSATTMQRLLLADGTRAGSRIVAVGDRGYIVYSDDQGATWKRANAPDAPLLTAVEFVDAKNGWAAGHDAVILATADGGETWTRQFSAPAEQRPLMDLLFVSKTEGFAVGAYGAFYATADGGKTWDARKIIEDDRHFNAILRLAEDRLLILGEAGTVLLSEDRGAKWSALESPYKGSFFGGVVADDGAVLAFGLRGRIYRSTDAGRVWKQVDNPSVAALMGGSKLPGGTLVLAGGAGTVLVSRDHGQSFVPLATGTTRTFAKALLGAPNAVILLGEAGVRSAPLPSPPR